MALTAQDYQGLAQVITAVGSVLSVGVSIVVLVRGEMRGAKLDTVQKHVNGMNRLIAAGAKAEGVIEGMDKERANSTAPPAA